MLTKIKIKTILELELAFIANQAQVLNNYYKLGDWNHMNRIRVNIKQKTPAFSYYIVKHLLFEYNLDNDNNNDNDINRILNLVLNKGFKSTDFKYLESLRMTLFTLY